MWQLFQFPLCPFSRKVRLVLAEKGVGHELVRENPWEKRDEFIDLNPAGETPATTGHPERARARGDEPERTFAWYEPKRRRATLYEDVTVDTQPSIHRHIDRECDHKTERQNRYDNRRFGKRRRHV